MNLSFKIISKEDLTDNHRLIFGNLLKKQGKLQGDFYQKADRCKFICFVKINNKTTAIGAIKQKTKSDFNQEKANLPELAKLFEWELGYIYTSPNNEGLGIASMIVKILIKEFGDNNLMAATEIINNPAMVKIFKKNGFRHFGNTWKSHVHGNDLGLFLKYK